MATDSWHTHSILTRSGTATGHDGANKKYSNHQQRPVGATFIHIAAVATMGAAFSDRRVAAQCRKQIAKIPNARCYSNETSNVAMRILYTSLGPKMYNKI